MPDYYKLNIPKIYKTLKTMKKTPLKKVEPASIAILGSPIVLSICLIRRPTEAIWQKSWMEF